jgi:hypothetical protein
VQKYLSIAEVVMHRVNHLTHLAEELEGFESHSALPLPKFYKHLHFLNIYWNEGQTNPNLAKSGRKVYFKDLWSAFSNSRYLNNLEFMMRYVPDPL